MPSDEDGGIEENICFNEKAAGLQRARADDMMVVDRVENRRRHNTVTTAMR